MSFYSFLFFNAIFLIDISNTIWNYISNKVFDRIFLLMIAITIIFCFFFHAFDCLFHFDRRLNSHALVCLTRAMTIHEVAAGHDPNSSFAECDTGVSTVSRRSCSTCPLYWPHGLTGSTPFPASKTILRWNAPDSFHGWLFRADRVGR